MSDDAEDVEEEGGAFIVEDMVHGKDEDGEQ